MTSELAPGDMEWTARAVRLDDFLCDTVFLVSTCIQFCDEITGHVIPGDALLLPTPDLPFIGTDNVVTSTLLGREEQLVHHYRRIVAAFASRDRTRQLRPGSNQFWLRPAVLSGGAILTSCLWYGTVPEAEALLLALIGAPNAPDGEIWDDLDQGWRIRIVKTKGLTCIAEWDWEDPGASPTGYVFDAVKMSQEARAALTRLRIVHRVLVKALGRDWWS